MHWLFFKINPYEHNLQFVPSYLLQFGSKIEIRQVPFLKV